jgi:hypothetical protein
MKELILHILLIWILVSLCLILVYNKLVVERRLEYNMYTGKGRKYNKKKARANYLKFTLLGGAIAFILVFSLRWLS